MCENQDDSGTGATTVATPASAERKAKDKAKKQKEKQKTKDTSDVRRILKERERDRVIYFYCSSV
jgi:hypothetical protein